MHAVVVSVTINDPDAAVGELNDQVVPQVSQLPGFVAGYWVRMADGHGKSILVFESEEQAQAAADRAQSGRMAVSFDSVEVGEVVASA
jgi:Protein of unknown function (DUF3240)